MNSFYTKDRRKRGRGPPAAKTPQCPEQSPVNQTPLDHGAILEHPISLKTVRRGPLRVRGDDGPTATR